MIRILPVLLAAVLAVSLVAPAYSLPASRQAAMSGLAESRPLSSLPSTQLPALDAVDIYGYKVPRGAIHSDFGNIKLGDDLLRYNGNPSRTLVFGAGNVGAIAADARVVGLGGRAANGQPFLGVAMSKNPLPVAAGLTYVPDLRLAYDSNLAGILANYTEPIQPGRLSGASIIGSDRVVADYNVTGRGTTVAIVDTGSDFSNDDMRHAVARDAKGIPMMLDADGQGIVLTRAKYLANIDVSGRILNYTGPTTPPLPHNATSYAFVNGTGVYLKTSQGSIPVYNTLYPFFGPPVLDGTANVDWKIGNSATNYIRSQSGIYRMGVAFEVSQEYGILTLVLVPVLLVDSAQAGVYDTIVPDMSYAWYSFTAGIAGAYPQTNYLIPPRLSFDFTDERPIKLGDGNEFLTYDYNSDGFADFSAGTVGARVLDIWKVTDNKTQVVAADKTGYGGVVSAKLLEPIDPAGEYLGLMYDFQGHGTSTAATVASKGSVSYSIYGNSTTYRLQGMAPDAKILPVKALWAGDAIYGWLYAAGFDQNGGIWNYTGNHRADIISNSWGISNFPLLKYGPGYDILSVFSSMLVVPGALAPGYPGTLMVDSAGNNGLGYGSVGSPNTSPFAISVGATTNNVHIQYSAFANITRFGSSAAAYDDVAEFSSRGPGLFGDPKPELMAVGSYGFTPADVTVKVFGSKKGEPNNAGAFALFGGTSMAAPMTAGAAALVVQEIKDSGQKVDPFKVKSILMSSAKDLGNDPFVQGAGRVDALAAIELAKGKPGGFSAYTDSTAENILDVLAPAIKSYGNTLGIISGYSEHLPAKFRESRWFAGQVGQGSSTSTDITIENPSKTELAVDVSSTVEKLVKSYQVHNSTKLFAVDPTHNDKKFGFAPNYFNVAKLAGGKMPDADLMVARVNFPFNSFMNSTELFADGLRIASVYAYDWRDLDRDGKVGFREATLVNRGGSWGTTQELRVGEPDARFKGTPVIGVYPVPTVFSFWRGDRLVNSTAMNYTLTVEFYKRLPNPDVQLQGVPGASTHLTVPPGGKATVKATVTARDDALSGIYYGEIMIKGSKHTVLMPLSYVVSTKPVPKDVPIVVSPGLKQGPDIERALGLRPNGYVGGLSDMTSRYSAGDWRSYYFNVSDTSITSMSLKVSWPHNSTSINAMAFGPDGKLVASSVPAGVFQEFAGWASNDWLGTSTVSEGGAFFFSQNTGNNSTTMYVPVNQTGIYSVLLHNTLFHGNSMYEPVQVEAKFSTLLPDTTPPKISAKLPEYVSGRAKIAIKVEDENAAGISYSIDGQVQPSTQRDAIVLDGKKLPEGQHTLSVEATDAVGHSSSVSSSFVVDRMPPSVLFKVGNDESSVAGNDIYLPRGSTLSWNITDASGIARAQLLLPGGRVDKPHSSSVINATDGTYKLAILSIDKAGNRLTRNLSLIVDSVPPAAALAFAGSDVSGTTTVGIDAQDANLKSAVLSIGHKSIDVTGMTEYKLDTADLADGKYKATLTVLDKAGNVGTATADVVVANVTPMIGFAAIAGIAGGVAAGAAVAWFVASRRRRA